MHCKPSCNQIITQTVLCFSTKILKLITLSKLRTKLKLITLSRLRTNPGAQNLALKHFVLMFWSIMLVLQVYRMCSVWWYTNYRCGYQSGQIQQLTANTDRYEPSDFVVLLLKPTAILHLLTSYLLRHWNSVLLKWTQEGSRSIGSNDYLCFNYMQPGRHTNFETCLQK